MKGTLLRIFAYVLTVILAVLLGIALLLPQPPGSSTPETTASETSVPADSKPLFGWLELPDGKYFLDDTGNPITGLFPCPQGSYYFDENGRMVIGWADTADGKRYFAEDGTMVVGFLDLDGRRYLFDRGGVLCTGWQNLDGQQFYFDETGALVTTPGWLYLEEGTWYIAEDGQPYTGWMQTDEGRYYFLEDGEMAVGSFYIDDVYRYFSSDGNYIPLVNPWNPVPEDYTPRLVSIEGEEMDSTCANALKQLIKGARDAGLVCELNSGYRDMDTQIYLWNRRYNDYISKGYSEDEAYRLTARRVAYPGTSEHHTGLAIDIVELVKDGNLYEWFRQHAWEYGFIVRYKGEKESLTGIKDEPWHLRYVGKEVAQILQENGWCLEEFWNQFSG